MFTDLSSELTALVTVIIIDLVLAGDNAIVVGMAAAGLPADQRKKAIVFGIAAAAIMRIVFALFTVQLLNIVGLLFVGGLLLLWVCWKLWREIRSGAHGAEAVDAHAIEGKLDGNADGAAVASDPAKVKPKSFRQAITQIIVADVSMSLDNVLAVAGTARHHVWVMVVGLALAVALMGVAATFIARVLKRWPWISYVGLLLILWVALAMMWEGAHEIWEHTGGAGSAVEAPAEAPAH